MANKLRNIGQILRIIQLHKKAGPWKLTSYDWIVLDGKEREPSTSLREFKGFLEILCDLEGVKVKFEHVDSKGNCIQGKRTYLETLAEALNITPSLAHALTLASVFREDQIDNLRDYPTRLTEFKFGEKQLKAIKQIRRYLLKILGLKEHKRVDLAQFRRKNAKARKHREQRVGKKGS